MLDPRTGYTVLPVRWDSAGRATELAHLGGQGWAQGVNQNGVIVGSSNDLPVYWDAAGNVTALPRLPDPGLMRPRRTR